jgi:hypothetical protein
MCNQTVIIVSDNKPMRNVDEVRARVGGALQLKPEYQGQIFESHGCLCPVDVPATAAAAGFSCAPPTRTGTIEWFVPVTLQFKI